MPAPSRPNVVVITTHDTGRHFGCYGIPTLNTPAIDRIASEGVRMTRYFSTVPICAASRVTMLTGLYPQTHGMYDLPIWGDRFHDHVQHLSKRMRAAGYQTLLAGIQHETRDMNQLAFDHVIGLARPGGGRRTAVETAEQAVSALRELDRSRPFYLQMGFFETHSPFDFEGTPADHSRGVYVPPYIEPNGPAYELLAKLQGAVAQADRAVDLFDRALHELGLADNTLLVFTVDHGLELPRAKWNLYDPGVEIALIVRWPDGGITGGRACDVLASNLDFTPTLLDLLNLPGGDQLQGASMARHWAGASSELIHEHIFGYYQKSDSRSVRTATHKLIINGVVRAGPLPPVDIQDTSRNIPVAPIELYDLTEDPLESRNLADSPAHAQMREQLLNQLWAWMESVDDAMLRGPTRSMWYDRAMAPYRAARGGESEIRTDEHQARR